MRIDVVRTMSRDRNQLRLHHEWDALPDPFLTTAQPQKPGKIPGLCLTKLF